MFVHLVIIALRALLNLSHVVWATINRTLGPLAVCIACLVIQAPIVLVQISLHHQVTVQLGTIVLKVQHLLDLQLMLQGEEYAHSVINAPQVVLHLRNAFLELTQTLLVLNCAFHAQQDFIVLILFL